MAPIDWIIFVILLLSVLTAAKQGFFVEAFSLAGVILGLLIASWNYQRVLPWLSGWIHTMAIAELVAFMTIAIGIMIVAGLIGRFVRWAVRSVGLGWADRFMGALFGLLKGCVLVTLGVMACAAFLPRTAWLEQSRLVPYFLSVAHQSAIVTPSDFGERIRHGVKMIREAQPDWLKPKANLAPRAPYFELQIKPGSNRA
jgi:membrane protein required for colicin V production